MIQSYRILRFHWWTFVTDSQLEDKCAELEHSGYLVAVIRMYVDVSFDSWESD